jgi:hypothetical protein
VEHLADELDARRLVWIGFFKVHDEAERSVFKGRVCGTDDDGIPALVLADSTEESASAPTRIWDTARVRGGRETRTKS